MEAISIKPLEQNDRKWAEKLLKKSWGSMKIVIRRKLIDAACLPGFKAVINGKNVGLVTYKINGSDCEIITLDSLIKNKGIGSSLIREVINKAKGNRCKRILAITTNDNLNALRFYQKRGFVLSALYPNALNESRKLKPEIPKIGINGIPLRDEIELEMKLG